MRALLLLVLLALCCRVAHVSFAPVLHVLLAMVRALALVAFGLLRAAVRA